LKMPKLSRRRLFEGGLGGGKRGTCRGCLVIDELHWNLGMPRGFKKGLVKIVQKKKKFKMIGERLSRQRRKKICSGGGGGESSYENRLYLTTWEKKESSEKTRKGEVKYHLFVIAKKNQKGKGGERGVEQLQRCRPGPGSSKEECKDLKCRGEGEKSIGGGGRASPWPIKRGAHQK